MPFPPRPHDAAARYAVRGTTAGGRETWLCLDVGGSLCPSFGGREYAWALDEAAAGRELARVRSGAMAAYFDAPVPETARLIELDD